MPAATVKVVSPTPFQVGIERFTGYMIDPVLFAFDGGFVADPWQAEYLRSSANDRMLNCSRQTGKSTTVAWDTIHTATFKPGSLTLLVSPGERQSMELMRKVQEVMVAAPCLPGVVADGALHAEFDNGSRIVALPGKEETVRGYSAVDKLVIDEASRVPNLLYIAVRPMLAVSGGRMDSLSTPFGTRGWWWEEWKRVIEARRKGRKPEWEYFEIPATKCPRITKEFLLAERERLGHWFFGQEYFCKFYDAQSQAFTASEVEAAFAEEVLSWDLDIPGFEEDDEELEWDL